MRKHGGFSLLELIGVMAVMAILSSVLAPSIVSTVDDAYARAEQDNLAMLANGLREHIVRTRSIPSTNSAVWSTALASDTDFAASQVLSNRRNRQRVLVADPRFFTSSDSAFGGYTQTTGLGVAPVSPRLLLISNLKGNVPSMSNTAATFNAVWNGDAGAVVVAGDNLKIERINLTNVFRHVLLTNSSPSQSAYALDTNTIMPVPAAVASTDGVTSVYVIDGTQMSLYAATYPAGALTNTVLVQRDFNHAYQTDNGSDWYWSAP
ncbi:MAG: type II secretion system protein [Gammaproteobacteria bacterium]